MPADGRHVAGRGHRVLRRLLPRPSADAPLTDRNVGSLTRTLGEAFARELAVLRKQLELVYDSAFIDTAEGCALDMVVALLGIERKAARLRQSAPCASSATRRRPADIFIPEGTRVSTSLALPAGGGKPRPVSFVTTADRDAAPGPARRWRRRSARRSRGPRGVVDAGTITVIDQTILGIGGVANDAPTVFGAAGESDAELRRRAKTVAERAGRATPRALTNALTGIAGLRRTTSRSSRSCSSGPAWSQVFVARRPEPSRWPLRCEQAHPRHARGGHPRRAQPGGVPARAHDSRRRSPGIARGRRIAETCPPGEDFRYPLSPRCVVFPEDPRVAGVGQDAIAGRGAEAVACLCGGLGDRRHARLQPHGRRTSWPSPGVLDVILLVRPSRDDRRASATSSCPRGGAP